MYVLGVAPNLVKSSALDYQGDYPFSAFAHLPPDMHPYVCEARA